MLVCIAFLLAYSSTILKQTETTSWSQSAGHPQVSQSISVFRKKKVPRVFFSLSLFWRIWSPLQRCFVALTTVQFKGLTFFLTSNNIYRVWTGWPPALAETTEGKGIFFFFLNFQDWHPLCGLWHHQITTKSYQQKQIICFLDLQVFFFFSFSICHCNLGSCAT